MRPLLTAVLLLAFAASAALANGAFPDSQGILLPSSRPEQIFLSTNFGLLRSDDSGQSWGWICEEAIGSTAFSYQVGPAPDHRLFAITSTGLVSSSDAGCSFQLATGLDNPSDVFPDQDDPLHVLAVARITAPDTMKTVGAIYSSSDGGQRFELSYSADPGVYIAGVESAHSDPNVVYLATSIYDGGSWHPSLKRSSDGGSNFTDYDLLPALGPVVPALLAVDRDDPDRVYLRLQGSGEQDAFAIYRNPDGVAPPPFQLQARMTGYLLRSDGALLLGSTAGTSFISKDMGRSFQTWKAGLHLRALGERDGQIYVAADDVQDGFALAVSSDGGENLRPVLRFAHISGPLACGELPAQCAQPWTTLQATLAIPADPSATEDAPDAATHSGPQATPAKSGCDCALARPSHPRHAAWLACIGVVAYGLRAGRRSRTRPRRH